jgi:tRNA dimethylallyltransferase
MPFVEAMKPPGMMTKQPDKRSLLVAVVGPTAVGKTATAVALAQRLGGEIVSADSRLLYRGMDIGTAKPTLIERAGVPHHLIDVADPDEIWSLATFQARAHQAIAEIHRRGRLPLLVGGTGQYQRAVAQGWQIPQVEPDPRLRQALEDWARQIGPHGLYARLKLLDPPAAEQIDPRNLRRTVRALEVILSTGKRFSAQRQQTESPYRLFQVGLNLARPELYARIDARIEAMIRAGLEDEVRGLLAAGYSPDLPSLSAIGYKEMIVYLCGEITLAEAVAQIKHNTRVFVRRQANWFKPGDPNIRWYTPRPDLIDQIETELRVFFDG